MADSQEEEPPKAETVDDAKDDEVKKAEEEAEAKTKSPKLDSTSGTTPPPKAGPLSLKLPPC